ncbi:hydrogenase [Citrobacter amalonaticus]|uniref:Hydrogenase n=1 Tax=Citrobacter amalonaticus TaxID=35703 RepID=A0A2S4S3Z8_CITAM|nr:sigma-54-dependent Fis family transcriptional regulator [Citrobacter amalonaticus]POT60022.1 hydrogenase [Citrobacter amalonaticus]POT78153.1 hydrogenase [Citrobacter amalonaticus]POU68605.1 hydrogenase [Citrobacter amalonaticus]POV08209.1 hydrogenase [Citrobacter amalonaticus]
MTMFDEAIPAPPEEISLDDLNDALLQFLSQQNDKASLLHAFIPLPPPFSAVELIELHFIDRGIWYRCFEDGSHVTATEAWQGEYAGCSQHVVQPDDRLMVELRFIRLTGRPFTPQETVLFNWLTRIITPALAALVDKVKQVTTLRAVAKECDHHRVLVDITNSVLSHLDLEELIADVANEIHHFFGVTYVSMVLKDSRQAGKYTLWSTDFSAAQPEHRQCLLPGESEVLAQTLRDNRYCLYCRADDPAQWQHDPLLHILNDRQLDSAILLPLTFGSHTPGILLLAHASEGVFSKESCKLLQHIADRIAIAVDNADAWRSMTDLKESLKQENRQLSEQLFSSLGPGDIIYKSQAMDDLLQQVEIVAPSDSTVLICGETGTGKEVIARAIHQLSLRHDKPLVKINCAAIPASLLESELFGHDKGAFTGAINTHRGRFELADGGTLFLDEIGDLPLELQPKLLRVLQEREIERLGGNKTIPVNVRVVAATNRDLWQMVEDREFRSDLFYRLNVFPLELPSLRERPEDIPLLAKYFTQKMAKRMNRTIDAIPEETLRQLMSWDWPGNVRELENVIERAVLLTRGTRLNLHLTSRQTRLLPALGDDIPTKGSMAQMLNPPTPENDEEERQRIIQVLKETNGIVAGPRGAATRLGMKRTTLLSRMQRLGIAAREVL